MASIRFAFVIGLGAIFLIYVLNSWLTKAWSPTAMFMGADKRLSTSKFQWWLWLWVIAFVYITNFAARCLALGRIATPGDDIPENILWILGISTGTMVISKGVTASYAAKGQIAKGEASTSEGSANRTAGQPAGQATGHSADLVADDSGHSDLAKLQIFIWTLIAVAIYLSSLVDQVIAASRAGGAQAAMIILEKFPDLDDSLMLLSGLSSTGYIGAKLVTRNAPSLTSLTPSSATVGSEQKLVIIGNNLGPAQGSGIVAIGPALDNKASSWTNNKIELCIPKGLGSGSYLVSVIVFGVKTNELTLELS